jgi:long-chain acyl-CoA synthetase
MRQTLLSLLDNCASRTEETAIIHWRGLRISRWSYGRLAATAYQFARELESRNVGKGACVLLWGENSPEWVAAFFGCLLRGAVAVPLDKLSAPDFVLRVQLQVKAKLLLHSNAVRPEVGLNLPSLRLDELSEAIAHHSSSPYSVENINGSDLIEIIFTSGTTAEPKGVCLTHLNFLASLAPLEEEIGQRRRWARIFHPLRFLNLLPLSHVFGQYMGIFVPQLLGGEVYFREALNPSEIIETARKQRIMVIAAFPRLLDTLRERVKRDYAARGKTESFKQALATAAGKHVLRRWWTFSWVHRLFGWKFWAFISGGATLNEETENFWRALGFAVYSTP